MRASVALARVACDVQGRCIAGILKHQYLFCESCAVQVVDFYV